MTINIICRLLAVALPLLACASSQAEQPNILLITIDDLNDWIEPLNGHPQAATPNLDKLAAEGLTFTNAHCASPSCNPSRTAILTGVAPHRSGIYQNWAEFRNSPALKNAKTLPQALRENGYHAVGGGKIFHAPNRRPDRWNSDPQSWDAYFGGAEVGPFFLPPEGREHMQENAVGKLDWYSIAETEEPPLDEHIVDWAAQTLAEEKLPEPFFMAVGILKPHLPLYAPERFFEMHPLDQVTLPPRQEDDRKDIPSFAYGLDPFLNYQYEHHVQAAGVAAEIVRAYLACVSYVDDCVGRVLTALDESGYKNNTLVIVVSDHGFHLGEKLHWGKFSLWEEATRSPFFLRGPGIPAGVRVDQAVSLLDIYPTLLDYLSIAPKRTLDGISLMPLARNTEMEWNRPVLTTSGRRNHSVRSNRWRYISYSNGTDELYDLKEDPNEWKNLADDPEHRDVKQWLHSHLPEFNAEEVF